MERNYSGVDDLRFNTVSSLIRALKRNFLKVRGDEQSAVTNSAKPFHARGPATTKALSRSDERRVAGTTRADDDADCNRRRDVTSAAG